MDFNLRELISNLNGKRIFYLSEEDLGEETFLEPMDNGIKPPPLLQNAKSDLDSLDVSGLNKIPFYNTINDALRCYGKEFTQQEFFVYSPTEEYNDVNIVKNKDLVKLTPMFKYMNELWVLDKIKVKCVGIIKIFETDNKEVNFCKGWDWKWVGYSQEMGDAVREYVGVMENKKELEELPLYMKKLVEKLRLNKIPKEDMVRDILTNPNQNFPITDTTISPGDCVPIVKINGRTKKNFTLYQIIKDISLDDKIVEYYPLPWLMNECKKSNFVTINNGYIYIYLNI